ncbi:MAG: hypothetical protein HY785_21695 [Oscillatoriophycideae cyanobacterium NC_groundwater_1537_Pr4_S-0.65um_50_18]|nr:hypothetical protein [Oscillatoriophycideae cyanobacterium NC_groundwater_1537_Pr4_S-0.65um_50_18]
MSAICAADLGDRFFPITPNLVIVMHKYLSLLVSIVLVPAHIFMDMPHAIAHQPLALEDVQATVHLEPDDSPYAEQPSPTWIHLMRSDGETVPLADCNCNVVVYDSLNQAIARPSLAAVSAEGHEQLMGTSITFPKAGDYRLVFAGQSRSEAFQPFELEIPVTVRP